MSTVILRGYTVAPTVVPPLRSLQAIAVALVLAGSVSVSSSARAQSVCDDVAALNDEFDNADTLIDWTNETVVDEWPLQVAVLDIDSDQPDAFDQADSEGLGAILRQVFARG